MLLEQAKIIAESVETWADLSNALFNQVDGLVVLAYPTRAERDAFRLTPEYAALWQLINDTIDRTGLIEGATPKKGITQ